MIAVQKPARAIKSLQPPTRLNVSKITDRAAKRFKPPGPGCAKAG